jgi:hypothetical protein
MRASADSVISLCGRIGQGDRGGRQRDASYGARHFCSYRTAQSDGLCHPTGIWYRPFLAAHAHTTQTQHNSSQCSACAERPLGVRHTPSTISWWRSLQVSSSLTSNVTTEVEPATPLCTVTCFASVILCTPTRREDNESKGQPARQVARVETKASRVKPMHGGDESGPSLSAGSGGIVGECPVRLHNVQKKWRSEDEGLSCDTGASDGAVSTVGSEYMRMANSPRDGDGDGDGAPSPLCCLC